MADYAKFVGVIRSQVQKVNPTHFITGKKKKPRADKREGEK